jgi:uncharacterized protein
MNSAIYTLKLSHERLEPRKNSFRYSIYLMYLDFDELDSLAEKFPLFSYNKWNVFSFFDEDHFKFVNPKNETAEKIAQENVKVKAEKYSGKNTKERVRTMIRDLNLDFELGKVFILTNLRNFGYIFNPVSFYYCFDKDGVFRVLFSEVNNTFHDQKMFFEVIGNPNEKVFSSLQKKNYYISPFISFDNSLKWQFDLPGEKMFMSINSLKAEKVELRTLLVGQRRELSNSNLLFLLLRYPLITVMIIFLIHYQALKLWLKKIKYYRKEETDEKIVSNIFK